MQRDIASHILVILLGAQTNHERYMKDSLDFLNWLLQNEKNLSEQAFTFALLNLVKLNHLAREFCTDQGFNVIDNLLGNACIHIPQVGYNTICILWILSNNEAAHKYFEDYTLALIEKVTKILDYCSWEKIVRMMLMLFDNVKENEICQEHLSDIDALSLITKLQNRHWVDEDINKLLEKLFEYFDENQKVFSSIEKLKNQVNRGQLRWGPCHTEQFWQENCALFDRADNLAMMKKLVNDCLLSKNDKSRAVACFDLGEFSRFVPNGKLFLERNGIKQKMADIMQDPKSSSEVKKEAITCY